MTEFVLNISASKNEPHSNDGYLAGGDTNDWAQLTRDIAKNGDRVAFAKYYESFFDTMFMTVKQATGCDEATCLDKTMSDDELLAVLSAAGRPSVLGKIDGKVRVISDAVPARRQADTL